MAVLLCLQAAGANSFAPCPSLGTARRACLSSQGWLEGSRALMLRERVITQYCEWREEMFSILYSGTPSQKMFPRGNYSSDAVNPGSGSPLCFRLAVVKMNGAD